MIDNQIVPNLAVSINRQYVGKIPKDATKALWRTFNHQFRTITTDLSGLIREIKAGHAFTAALEGHHRKVDYFKSAQHIGLDFDTEDQQSAIETLAADKFIGTWAAFIYTSPSHTPEKPRARVVFILDQAITDPEQYSRIARGLVKKYGLADQHCTDAVRLWFASPNCEVRELGKILPLDVAEQYAAAFTPKRKTPPSIPGKTYTPTDDTENAKSALEALAGWRCSQYDPWLKVGMSLKPLGDAGLTLWDNWSKDDPGYQAGECDYKFNTFSTDGITLASLFFWADEDSPGWRSKKNGYHAQELQYPDMDDLPPGPPGEDWIEPAPEPALPPPPARKTSWTAGELLTTEFPAPNWSIPEVIPEGLTILGGRPKVGKSWMALQMSYSIGTGGRCFNRKVEPGNVLYLAYEDNERRLKDRMMKMRVPGTAAIRFEFSWPRLYKTGLSLLIAELDHNPYRMVVIDTIARAMAGLKDSDADAEYSRIYDTMQRLALAKGISIVILDHTRKRNGITSDPIDDIINATSKTAIADAILAIYKEQGKRGAKLMGRGRDIEDIDWDLTFDSTTASWQLDDSPYTERQSEILQALGTLGKASLNEISKNIGQPKPHTLTRLNTLVDSRKVNREMVGREVYFWLA